MRKMVLVPFDKFKQSDLNTEKGKLDSKTDTNISGCFWKKSQPVDSSSSENYKKDVNSTSLSKTDIVTVKPSTTLSNQPVKDLQNQIDKMPEDVILYPFSKRQRRGAESLLQYIKKHLSWNSDGEIICHGKVVEGSHVTDLLKDALAVNKKTPANGYQEFYACLKGVPLSLIINKDRKLLVGKGFTDIGKPSSVKRLKPPPPGYPVNKKPRDINAFDFLTKWKTK